MKALLVLLLLALMSGCNSQNGSPPVADANIPLQDTWSYFASRDKMDGSVTYSALTFSTEKLPGQFPYQRNEVLLLVGFPSGVVFKLHGAQFKCSGGYLDTSGYPVTDTNTCSIRVRFDKGPVEQVGAREYGDANNFLEIVDGAAFLKKLKTSKQVLVEFNVYDMGAPVMTFDVQGFSVASLLSAKP